MRDEGIEAFLRDYYPDLIDRFYSGVPEGFLEIEIRQMINDWIKSGNPLNINNLPEILQTRLFPLTELSQTTNYLGV